VDVRWQKHGLNHAHPKEYIGYSTILLLLLLLLLRKT